MSKETEKFPVSELIKKVRAKQNFRGLMSVKKLTNTSSVDMWIKEEQVNTGFNPVRALTAYAAYVEWCNKQQLDAKAIASVRTFGTRLKDLNLPYEEKQRKVYYMLNKSFSEYEEKAENYQTASNKSKSKKDASKKA